MVKTRQPERCKVLDEPRVIYRLRTRAVEQNVLVEIAGNDDPVFLEKRSIRFAGFKKSRNVIFDRRMLDGPHG